MLTQSLLKFMLFYSIDLF